ncbi:hypothetical protein DSL72_009459 [Monilinia vaccinii-corymbosi]|uniref:C2H2-type domain-containing protein n=1 Tax=Monilinia vaccinii-corymbosi TaxID=61207 RepID=A0A8A3PR88_9HELO|nr:hypothetical protein DSL72_009459 [Monilinia vaccinii-corymbosi]
MSAAMSSNSPESNGGEDGGEEVGDNVADNVTESTTSAAGTITVQPADSFPSKTDKPKPHGCHSCGRHFARLEHLKRHERIHTKEKPFACSECGRAFSRRDLQIRHQQKLHSETTPPAKPRDRRTSVASSAGGANGSHRVQKNSGARMRPRANTLSHVEGAFMQLTMDQMATESLAAGNQNRPLHLNLAHSRHPSLAELPMTRDYEFGGMSGIGGMSTAMDHRGMPHGLPKIDTSTPSRIGYSGGLRTAPIPGGFQPSEFEFDHSFRNFGFPTGNDSTINPSALHLDDSPLSMAIDPDTFRPHFPDASGIPMLEDNFAWDPTFNQMNFDAANENAIDGSSPSAISTASYSGISDGIMLDGSNNTAPNTASMWQQPMMGTPLMSHNFVDHGNQQLANFANGNHMSPHILPHNHANSTYFPTQPPLGPSVVPGLNSGMNHTQGFHSPMTLDPGTPNSIPGGVPGSLPLSTITDSTRSVLMTALAQETSFGARKYSFPSFPSANSPSPLSPRFPARANNVSESTRFLPSTFDLQRYIGAYIKYFHPHLPFLHIPTLSFDLRAYTNDGRGASASIDGPGCLALSMAAIGALYETDHLQAKALFESAKKMLQLYIEERRKVDLRRADHRKTSVDHNSRVPQASVHTPVWLAQAMLLNIIYGFNCGDKVTADNSFIHCATLVSLAKAAELIKPPPSHNGSPQQDVRVTSGDNVSNGYIKPEIPDDQQEWLDWKVAEERKRALFAIFILSSMLMSAYNHAPALTNSEIESDLPCDEEFWSAENANSFYAMGGSASADRKKTTFKAALSELLQASNKPQYQQGQAQSYGNGHNAQDLPQNHLEPSAFGCLILINALHNYIWETRQRHTNKAWTNEDTEKMHHHIEPALKAWQSAWQRNPNHCVSRPNPNGAGPLSADSVPLLDLAYIRLFVNMSQSKEKFWQRDFDGMASELSRGNGIVPNEEHSPSSNADSIEFSSGSTAGSVFVDSPASSNSPPDFKSSRALHYSSPPTSSAALLKRERRLRRAANYAADSLTMSDQFGITFADFTSRELPLQSAMCAFDCAQVIAEWITSLQERVGCHLGILGKNDIDISQLPDMMLVEVEDMRLLHKIRDIINSAERKMDGLRGLPATDNCGYGSKILRVTAYMLNRAAVWPVTRIMAHALETQAVHMQTRTESSISQR